MLNKFFVFLLWITFSLQSEATKIGSLSLKSGEIADLESLTPESDSSKIKSVFINSFWSIYQDFNPEDLGKSNSQEVYEALPQIFDDEWEDFKKNSDISYVSVKLNNKEVAFASYKPFSNTQTLLLLLAVDPDYKRQGIGKELLHYVVSQSPNKDIILDTRKVNIPALSFYYNQGFKDADKPFCVPVSQNQVTYKGLYLPANK